MKKPERFKFNAAFPESCIVELNMRRARRRILDIAPGYDPLKIARERRFKAGILTRRNGAFPKRLVPARLVSK